MCRAMRAVIVTVIAFAIFCVCAPTVDGTQVDVVELLSNGHVTAHLSALRAVHTPHARRNRATGSNSPPGWGTVVGVDADEPLAHRQHSADVLCVAVRGTLFTDGTPLWSLVFGSARTDGIAFAPPYAWWAYAAVPAHTPPTHTDTRTQTHTDTHTPSTHAVSQEGSIQCAAIHKTTSRRPRDPATVDTADNEGQQWLSFSFSSDGGDISGWFARVATQLYARTATIATAHDAIEGSHVSPQRPLSVVCVGGTSFPVMRHTLSRLEGIYGDRVSFFLSPPLHSDERQFADAFSLNLTPACGILDTATQKRVIDLTGDGDIEEELNSALEIVAGPIPYVRESEWLSDAWMIPQNDAVVYTFVHPSLHSTRQSVRDLASAAWSAPLSHGDRQSVVPVTWRDSSESGQVHFRSVVLDLLHDGTEPMGSYRISGRREGAGLSILLRRRVADVDPSSNLDGTAADGLRRSLARQLLFGELSHIPTDFMRSSRAVRADSASGVAFALDGHVLAGERPTSWALMEGVARAGGAVDIQRSLRLIVGAANANLAHPATNAFNATATDDAVGSTGGHPQLKTTPGFVRNIEDITDISIDIQSSRDCMPCATPLCLAGRSDGPVASQCKPIDVIVELMTALRTLAGLPVSMETYYGRTAAYGIALHSAHVNALVTTLTPAVPVPGSTSANETDAGPVEACSGGNTTGFGFDSQSLPDYFESGDAMLKLATDNTWDDIFRGIASFPSNVTDRKCNHRTVQVIAVVFVREGCAYCDAVIPMLARVAQNMSSEGIGTLLVVDCSSTGKRICETLVIPGYPSLSVYRSAVVTVPESCAPFVRHVRTHWTPLKESTDEVPAPTSSKRSDSKSAVLSRTDYLDHFEFDSVIAWVRSVAYAQSVVRLSPSRDRLADSTQARGAHDARTHAHSHSRTTATLTATVTWRREKHRRADGFGGAPYPYACFSALCESLFGSSVTCAAEGLPSPHESIPKDPLGERVAAADSVSRATERGTKSRVDAGTGDASEYVVESMVLSRADGASFELHTYGRTLLSTLTAARNEDLFADGDGILSSAADASAHIVSALSMFPGASTATPSVRNTHTQAHTPHNTHTHTLSIAAESFRCEDNHSACTAAIASVAVSHSRSPLRRVGYDSFHSSVLSMSPHSSGSDGCAFKSSVAERLPVVVAVVHPDNITRQEGAVYMALHSAALSLYSKAAFVTVDIEEYPQWASQFRPDSQSGSLKVTEGRGPFDHLPVLCLLRPDDHTRCAFAPWNFDVDSGASLVSPRIQAGDLVRFVSDVLDEGTNARFVSTAGKF